ncbi:MAG TPA: polysaccharide deacetylase family protein [Kiritimatiellia bacterium]|nr:polysaccharide deacetylase family protein [Kiritimatiellia bacterium]
MGKRLFILAQWAVLIALVIHGVRTVARPVPPPDYDPDSWASWRGFHALSYAGVTRGGGSDHVTPHQLAAHLQALREAGYKSITPGDIEAYLEGRVALPDRAVLLLFEGGRKDSYLAATPLLRKSGQVAVMCVPTLLTRRWGSFYLREGDLKKFLKDPHWRLASMGHAAVTTIPVADGEEGRFLVRRQRLKTHVESEAEYRARVEQDFARAADILARASGQPVATYLFPFADAGASPGATPEAIDVLRAAAAMHHRIAFTRADDAFNGPDSDPMQLTRLRVRGTWDAARLLEELARSEPRDIPVTSLPGAHAWSFDGAGSAQDGVLHLGDGARAWLRGSSDWSDLQTTAAIERPAGAQLSLYARYAGPTRYVRVTANDEGLRVQERLGATMQTLAFLPATNTPNGGAEWTLRIKGNRLWMERPGTPPVGPLPLTRHTSRGRIGFEARGDGVGVRSFTARQLPGLAVRSASLADIPEEQRPRTSVWMPRWFNTEQRPEFTGAMRADLLDAAAQGIQVMPWIDMEHGAPRQDFAADLVALFSGVAEGALVTRFALSAPDDPLAEALRRQGYGILQHVSTHAARRLALDGRAGREGDWLLLAGNPLEAAESLAELQRGIPSTRLLWMTDKDIYLPPGVRRAAAY